MAVLSNEDFFTSQRNAYQSRLDDARTCGPVYQGRRNEVPLIWYHQAFCINKAPSGTVESDFPLRVGGTQSQIDLVIVANHNNATPITIAKDASFKVELLQSETEDGTYAPYGWSHTSVAPQAIKVEHDRCLLRLAIGNTELPWVKVRLTINGNVTGGNIDVGLAFLPR